MAQINQDRYEILGARALGVKGAGIFGHAEDAIFAGLALDTNGPIEFWYTQRIYRYALGKSIAAVSGARGGIELRNATLDQLWIVDYVCCSSAAVGEFALWVGKDTTADFYANALLSTGLDTRIPGGAFQDLGSSGTGAATIPGFGQIDAAHVAINTPHIMRPGVTLGPGGSFIANNLVANVESQFGIYFHTRQAMPSELS